MNFKFSNHIEGDIFEFVPGVQALFIKYDNKSCNVVVSVNGFVLKLHKYDHGQRRKWFFVTDGKIYYAQGHYRLTDDTKIYYTVQLSSCDEDANYEDYPRNTYFTEKNIYRYYYINSEHYKKQVDTILGHS